MIIDLVFILHSNIVIEFQPLGKRVEVPIATTILDAALVGGIGIRSVCGGKGSCGKCKVVVREGKIEFDRSLAKDFLTKDELDKGYVLACLAKVLSNSIVFIPPESRIERARLLYEAVLPRISPLPAISKNFVSPSKSCRYLEKLSMEILSEDIRNKISNIIDLCNKGITTIYWVYGDKKEVIDIEIGDTVAKSYGIAIDIGTTKIVVYLVDLATGNVLDIESDYNKQLIYGEDVVSRISHVVKNKDNLLLLKKAIVDTINSLIHKIAMRKNIDVDNIYEASVAGNTVMTYFFVGIDPTPLLNTGVEVPRNEYVLRSRDIGLSINPGGKIYCLPCAGRFLGGDVIGDILASGMHNSSEISLLIDIGTNTEVVIGCRDWFIATTAPGGPAFEGWGIKFGMRATEGAIERVRIDPKTLRAEYSVIGNKKPMGICGSGLIDLIAEMFRNKVIDTLGKIRRDIESPYIRKGSEGYEYVVVPAEESALGVDIIITEKDIYNLIDSKSSVCAAVAVLLKKMRLSLNSITKVYVCGAFGKYLNIDSAIAIGMIPEFARAELVYIGNGSLAGAYATLVSIKYREEATRVARLIMYYDLMKDIDFMDEYLAGFVLPGKKELFPRWWEASRKR